MLFILLCLVVTFSLYRFYDRMLLPVSPEAQVKAGDTNVPYLFFGHNADDYISVNVKLESSDVDNHTDFLQLVAGMLADSLKESKFRPYIKAVKWKVEIEDLEAISSTFIENLPLFMSAEDYQRMDSIIISDGIEDLNGEHLKELLSPPELAIADIISHDPIRVANMAFQRLQGLSRNNMELYQGSIFSKDRKSLILFIYPVYSYEQTEKNGPFIKELNHTIESIVAKNNNHVAINFYGKTATQVISEEQLLKDIYLIAIVGLIGFVILSGFFFRKVKFLLLLLLPAGLGAALALTLLVLFRENLEIPALFIASVLMGITAEYVFRMIKNRRSMKLGRSLFFDFLSPAIISSLTSSVLFFMIAMIGGKEMISSSLVSVICIAGAGMFSIIVLPHFISRKHKESGSPSNDNTLLDRFATLQFKHNKVLLISIAVLTVFFVYSSRNVSFEDDINRLVSLTGEISNAEQILGDISDPELGSVLLVAKGLEFESALERTAAAQRILDSLLERKMILAYHSAGVWVNSAEKQLDRLVEWKEYWSEDRIEKLSLLARRSIQDTTGLSIDKVKELLSQEYSTKNIENFLEKLGVERVSEEYSLPGTIGVLKVNQRDKDSLIEQFKGIAGFELLDSKAQDSLYWFFTDNIQWILLGALAVIFIFLSLALGRIEMGLITLLPILIGLSWTFGIVGLLGLHISVYSLIVSVFIFTLGIDYSIFITKSLINEYQGKRRNLASLKTAVLISLLTIITGAVVFLFTQHPVVRSVAGFSVIGIVSVIFITYTLLPRLYWFLVRNGRSIRKVPVTITGILYASACYLYFLLGGLMVIIVSATLLQLVPGKKRKKIVLHYMLMYVSRSTFYVMYLVRRKIIRPQGFDLKTPAMYISNHQSIIDIPLSLMFTPKMIVLTTNWPQSNPITGLVTRLADFYPVSLGPEVLVAKLSEMVAQGYSVFVFPEGTRSKDGNIGRFHKGAFFLAEQLKIDIIPIVIHGTGEYVAKGELLGRPAIVTARFFPRVKHNDTSFGNTYQERTKSFNRFFRREFGLIKKGYATVDYNRDKVIKKYIYKETAVEGIVKSRLKDTSFLEQLNKALPEEGYITHLGCGTGELLFLFSELSAKRKLVGYDTSSEYLEIARSIEIGPEIIGFYELGEKTDKTEPGTVLVDERTAEIALNDNDYTEKIIDFLSGAEDIIFINRMQVESIKHFYQDLVVLLEKKGIRLSSPDSDGNDSFVKYSSQKDIYEKI